MISLLAAAVFLATPQAISLSVDANPGDTISGVRHFRVTVQADDPVTSVEFYVNNELRDSDSSVPYEFNLDTIEEKDGDVELTFAAYTTKGDSAKRVLDLKIDNGLSEGAEAHVQKARAFLANSQWDDALLQGRIALRIDAQNDHAREVMARAYLGEGVLDKAKEFAEDWLTSEPSNQDAAQLVSGLDVRQAFSTLSRGSDREAALKSIQDALKHAIDIRQQLLQDKLEKIGPPTEDNAIQYADAAIAAGRLNLAITSLSDQYAKHVDRSDITNRLAYAQLLSGKTQDAYETLLQVERLARLDTYGNALMALIYSIGHDDARSGRYMSQAEQLDSSNLGVETAQSFIALKAGKLDDLAKIVTSMQSQAPSSTEVNYYLSALADAQGNYEDGRKYFETELYADPLSEEAYVLEGDNYLAFAMQTKSSDDDKKFRVEGAKAMYETALEVRPESYHGLVGLAIACMMIGEKEDALKYALAAQAAAPTQPVVLFTLAAAYSVNEKPTEAYKVDRDAWVYDRTILGGRAVPSALDAYQYYSQYGRIPVIAPPN